MTPVLASSYPLLDVFLSILWFALFFLWIWILIMVVIDLFSSRDLSGFAKALWFIFLIFLPFLGVLFYLLIRGNKMHQHAEQAAQEQDEATRAYIQEVAATPPASKADEVEKLARLRDSGVLSDEEFEREKARVLSGSASS